MNLDEPLFGRATGSGGQGIFDRHVVMAAILTDGAPIADIIGINRPLGAVSGTACVLRCSSSPSAWPA